MLSKRWSQNKPGSSFHFLTVKTIPVGLFPVEGNRNEKGRNPVKFRNACKKICYIDKLQKDKAPLKNNPNKVYCFFLFLLPYNPLKWYMPCPAQISIILQKASNLLKITCKNILIIHSSNLKLIDHLNCC